MTPQQCRAARTAVGLTASALAKAAGLRRMAVEDLEMGEGASVENQDALQRVLEEAGVEFFEKHGEAPGVRLQKVAS